MKQQKQSLKIIAPQDCYHITGGVAPLKAQNDEIPQQPSNKTLVYPSSPNTFNELFTGHFRPDIVDFIQYLKKD